MTPLEKIITFESQFNPSKWEIKGVSVWPYIRISILAQAEKEGAMAITDRRYFSTEERVNVQAPEGIHARQIARRQKIEEYIPMAPNKIGVFYSAKARTYDNDCRYYSRHIEGLKNLLGRGRTLQTFNFTPNKGYDDSKNIYLSLRLLTLIGYLISPFFRLNYAANIDACRCWLRDHDLPTEHLNERNIKKRFGAIWLKKLFFSKLIKKHNLLGVVIICWYDDVGMSLSWAARERSIHCHDLQHGLAGACKQRAYADWTDLSSSRLHFIPTNFLCWSDEDAIEVDNWSAGLKNGPTAITTGNLWNRFWKEQSKDVDKYIGDRFLDKISGPKILITLQGSIPDIVWELLDYSEANWNWLIRAHPLHPLSSEELQRIEDCYPQAEHLCTTGSVLPYLLEGVDVHLTGWSAVAQDSIDFEIPTIAYSKNALYYFQAFQRTKLFFILLERDQILNRLSSLIDSRSKLYSK